MCTIWNSKKNQRGKLQFPQTHKKLKTFFFISFVLKTQILISKLHLLQSNRENLKHNNGRINICNSAILIQNIVCYSYIKAAVDGNVCTSKQREQQSIKTKDILGNHHRCSGLRLKELVTQFNLCYNNSSHSSGTMQCCWHRKWEDNEYFRIVKEKNSQDDENRQARANKGKSLKW